MRSFYLFCVAAIVAALAADLRAQREHTRLKGDRSTAVSETQASELTLTLNEASVRPIQVWVRTAGRLDDAGKVVSAEIPAGQAAYIRVGQRVRAFSPESRSRMYQATVTRVAP